MRELPVPDTARRRYGLGAARVLDLPGARAAALAVNRELEPGQPPIQAGELAAFALLHEVFHLVVERVAALDPDGAMAPAAAAVARSLDAPGIRRLSADLGSAYPPAGAATGTVALHTQLEDLLLLRVGLDSPAAGPLRTLVDHHALRSPTADAAVLALVEFFAARPPLGPGRRTLVDLLRAPAHAHPTSLAGQLAYVATHWVDFLGALMGDALAALLRRIELVRDVIAEEDLGLHRRFGFGGTGGADGGGGGRPDVADLRDLEAEPERFSSDSAWMPRLVLIAKSTHVWLDQLSRRYGRDLRTLDAIPDEELERLARWGITGLWLIGLWQRSRASQRIKTWRGNPDAAASAYSLDEYRIADDLGGEAAWADLRHRAWQRGIRLASDMVPNHMGIDSRWVIEHPEWFLSLPEPPYPAYAFGGENVAEDDRVEVRLEDHYWDSTDAAVVFERRDRWTGDRRYIYHGNDGTSFPWNDTAQLDFSQAAVREQVIRTIVDVARRFPVIRFDAAMVLAKKHVRRLWFPAPGEGGGAIPSRAEFGTMTQADFDAAMPDEFWREVVDRVAAEVPGTLLLAEAFWLLEGYFVRTLGMHRVYNSAFMHMLRDEDNAGYRRVLRDTLEFDPEILKRYVNFMNNPDEATAVQQFGSGDKYIGVATLLATLPGLPMFGHGQFEGFAEKYGMEFRRAQRDEPVDAHLVARHERDIVPLLHRRGDFAEAADFRLFDVVTDGGGVAEDVFAFANGTGQARSVVLFHNRFAEVSGRIRTSVPYAVKAPDGSRQMVTSTLAEALGVADGSPDGQWLAFRDQRSGLEHLVSVAELRERGLRVALRAYECRVLWDLREHTDRDGPWAAVAARVGDTGVRSLDDVARDVELAPVHQALAAALDAPTDRSARRLVDAVAQATGTAGDRDAVTEAVLALWAASRSSAQAIVSPLQRAAFDGWAVLARLGSLPAGADVAATTSAWFDELRLGPALVAALRASGVDEAGAASAADRVRLLLHVPDPASLEGPAAGRPLQVLESWLDRAVLRAFLQVHAWEGAEYVHRESFEELVTWWEHLERQATPTATRLRAPVARNAVTRRLLEAGAQGGYRIDRMRDLLASPPSRTPSGAGAATPPRLPKATGLPPGPREKRRKSPGA